MGTVPRQVMLGFEAVMEQMSADYGDSRVKWYIGEHPAIPINEGQMLRTQLSNGQRLSAHVYPNPLVEA